MGFRALRLETIILPLALVALTALSACVRNGPPAPVIMGGDAESAGIGSGSSGPVAVIAPAPAARVSARPAAPLAPPAPPPAPPVRAALPTAAPQSHPSHPDQIVIGQGETLYMIARRYGVPLRSIIDANHLDPPFRLAAGTRLSLPQTRFHIVQAGETLYAISRLYGVEVSTLASVNRLGAPYAIRSGEALKLPAAIEPPEQTASLSPAARPEAAPAPRAFSPAAPANSSPAAAEPPEKPAPDQSRSVTTSGPKRGARVFAWPLEGRILESDGTGPTGTHNDGINIAARAGEAVRAADAGVVAYAGNELRGYGNLVLIKHPGGYMTAYAHNGRLLVKRGQAVKRGQEIAKAGATGSVSAPQLHFEIRQGTRALDPTGYLPALRASAN